MRIWFNHWFSSAYRIIELLKKEYNENCFIVGTNDKQDCVYKKVCDLFEKEPIFQEENDYINWALDFCKKHKIEIFFPRRNMVSISKRKKDFEKINVTVILSAESDVMELFNDKGKTYIDMKNNNLCPIPDFKIVNTVKEFQDAYRYLKENHPLDRITFKYSCGEGATSFRVIDSKVSDLSVLDTGVGLKLTFEDSIKLLSTKNEFKDLMVMPYLKGPEISIDCLNLKNQFLGICRNKMGSRVTEIYQDKTLLDISKNVAEHYNLYGPFNIQFRMHNDIPYLLEINTRMSGGIHMSCLSGINFPYLAIENALNKKIVKQSISNLPIRVSQIETPIIL